MANQERGTYNFSSAFTLGRNLLGVYLSHIRQQISSFCIYYLNGHLLAPFWQQLSSLGVRKTSLSIKAAPLV